MPADGKITDTVLPRARATLNVKTGGNLGLFYFYISIKLSYNEGNFQIRLKK